ncbi:MAG: type II toxin-antitoxin system VapC family toxin [Chitinispirillales bacterium]|jgi:PIN domain nuclease of toxin-antitoxin system|nr:type II toxin-antitoxin system VapC family toxin [Chitinispirillales bacterium]
MKLLLDTHILLWAAADTLPGKAAELVASEQNTLLFSTASIWEIVIKNGLGRSDFQIDVDALYNGLLDNGYAEVFINSRHSIIIGNLPPVHKDPFDRILAAQAQYEDATLVICDDILAKYPCSVICIKRSSIIQEEPKNYK